MFVILATSQYRQAGEQRHSARDFRCLPVNRSCSNLREVGRLTTDDVEDGRRVTLGCLSQPFDGVGNTPAHAGLALLIEDAEESTRGQYDVVLRPCTITCQRLPRQLPLLLVREIGVRS